MAKSFGDYLVDAGYFLLDTRKLLHSRRLMIILSIMGQ